MKDAERSELIGEMIGYIKIHGNREFQSIQSVSLNWFNRRFGKITKKSYGMSPRQFVSSTDELVLIPDRKGGTRVAVIPYSPVFDGPRVDTSDTVK